MDDVTTDALAMLDGHDFANLTTFRRNGQPVTTPVWFAKAGASIYVMTMASAGKVKRLRNNPAARLGPSDRSGKPLGADAEVRGRLLGPEEQALAKQALSRKYGWQKKLFDLMFKLRGKQSDQVYLEFRA